jgi:hypothetical protein
MDKKGDCGRENVLSRMKRKWISCNWKVWEEQRDPLALWVITLDGDVPSLEDGLLSAKECPQVCIPDSVNVAPNVGNVCSWPSQWKLPYSHWYCLEKCADQLSRCALSCASCGVHTFTCHPSVRYLVHHWKGLCSDQFISCWKLLRVMHHSSVVLQPDIEWGVMRLQDLEM